MLVFLASNKLNNQVEDCLTKQSQQVGFSVKLSNNKLSRKDKEVSLINQLLLLQACLVKLEINQSQVHFSSQQDKDF